MDESTKQGYLGQLHLLRGRLLPGSDICSIASWKKAVDTEVHHIKDRITEDLPYYKNNKLALAPGYALLSTLAILVSKEFNTCLEALITEDWTSFDKVFPEEIATRPPSTTLEQYRSSVLFNITSSLSTAWKNALFNSGSCPVEILSHEEMKLCLTPAFAKPQAHDEIQEWRRHYALHNKIRLSIDIFSPIETIVEQTKEIVKILQEEYMQERKRSWLEFAQGDAGNYWKGFVDEQTNNDRLAYDFRRKKRGNQKTRTGSTTFENWLKYFLSEYYYSILGMKPKEIAQQDWCKEIRNVENYSDIIARYRVKAKKLISAAINGQNLASVKTY